MRCHERSPWEVGFRLEKRFRFWSRSSGNGKRPNLSTSPRCAVAPMRCDVGRDRENGHVARTFESQTTNHQYLHRDGQHRGLLSRATGIAVGVARWTAGSHISAPAIGWCDEVHQRAAAPRFDSCAAADARGEIAEPALRPARSCAGWAIFIARVDLEVRAVEVCRSGRPAPGDELRRLIGVVLHFGL